MLTISLLAVNELQRGAFFADRKMPTQTQAPVEVMHTLLARESIMLHSAQKPQAGTNYLSKSAMKMINNFFESIVIIMKSQLIRQKVTQQIHEFHV